MFPCCSNHTVEVEMFTYIVEGILLTVVSLIGKLNYDEEQRRKILFVLNWTKAAKSSPKGCHFDGGFQRLAPFRTRSSSRVAVAKG